MRCHASMLSDFAALPVINGYRSRVVHLPQGRLVLCLGGSETLAPTRIQTGLKVLQPEGVEEFLHLAGGKPVQQDGPVQWQSTAELALLAIEVDDASLGIEAATRHAYQTLLETACRHHFPYLVRVWNYLADINGMERGVERYRDFCVGRHAAFSALGIADDDYPSACALGHADGPLLVYLLASRSRVKHFENPVQTSAYRYPQCYGPRSPSFARATLLSGVDCRPRLFVSGTASVVGHETRHKGDIDGQLQVTLSNLDCLTQYVGSQSGLVGRLGPDLLKVYVRYPEHLATVRCAVEAHYGDVPVVYVQADICRSDLLVEIDGVWGVN